MSGTYKLPTNPNIDPIIEHASLVVSKQAFQ